MPIKNRCEYALANGWLGNKRDENCPLRPYEERILDKIRAEIEQLRLHKSEFLTNDGKVCIDSQEVLAIIDKYRAESEK